MPNINLKTMSVDALFKLRGDVDSQLASRRADLEKQIALMGGDRIRSGKPGRKAGSKLAGRKIAPKFRSKKDPSLQWAGRGATPRWMREEMKAGKLKKEAFAIK